MPIREYQCLNNTCSQCTRKVEVLNPEKQTQYCEICSEQMEELFPTKTSFKLEGPGWGDTGYEK